MRRRRCSGVFVGPQRRTWRKSGSSLDRGALHPVGLSDGRCLWVPCRLFGEGWRRFPAVRQYDCLGGGTLGAGVELPSEEIPTTALRWRPNVPSCRGQVPKTPSSSPSPFPNSMAGTLGSLGFLRLFFLSVLAHHKGQEPTNNCGSSIVASWDFSESQKE